MSQKYYNFMREFNRNEGYTSFYGSNKKDFQDAWARAKDVSIKPRPEVAEMAGMAAKEKKKPSLDEAIQELYRLARLKEIDAFKPLRTREKIARDYEVNVDDLSTPKILANIEWLQFINSVIGQNAKKSQKNSAANSIEKFHKAKITVKE
jgi:hypothetical protein